MARPSSEGIEESVFSPRTFQILLGRSFRKWETYAQLSNDGRHRGSGPTKTHSLELAVPSLYVDLSQLGSRLSSSPLHLAYPATRSVRTSRATLLRYARTVVQGWTAWSGNIWGCFCVFSLDHRIGCWSKRRANGMELTGGGIGKSSPGEVHLEQTTYP